MPIFVTAAISLDTKLLKSPLMVYCSLELRIVVLMAPVCKRYFSILSRLLGQRKPTLSRIYGQIQKPLSDNLTSIYQSVHNSILSSFTKYTPLSWHLESNAWCVLRVLTNWSFLMFGPDRPKIVCCSWRSECRTDCNQQESRIYEQVCVCEWWRFQDDLIASARHGQSSNRKCWQELEALWKERGWIAQNITWLFWS